MFAFWAELWGKLQDLVGRAEVPSPCVLLWLYCSIRTCLPTRLHTHSSQTRDTKAWEWAREQWQSMVSSVHIPHLRPACFSCSPNVLNTFQTAPGSQSSLLHPWSRHSRGSVLRRISTADFTNCFATFEKKTNHIAFMTEWKYSGHQYKQIVHTHILSGQMERKHIH